MFSNVNKVLKHSRNPIETYKFENCQSVAITAPQIFIKKFPLLKFQRSTTKTVTCRADTDTQTDRQTDRDSENRRTYRNFFGHFFLDFFID